MAKLALAWLVAAAELCCGGVCAAHAADDWRKDHPGVERRLTLADIPPPKRGTSKEAADISNHPTVVRAPPGATLKVPPGFRVQRLASGLARPRVIRIAPNGDIFVAESGAGRILVFRPGEGRGPARVRPDLVQPPLVRHVFAAGLDRPYGIAFFPAGPSPQWVYVGEPGRIVRFPYRPGALAATGPAQVVIPNVPSVHHWTRDVIVAPDGKTLFYAVGSGSNTAGDMPPAPPGGLARFTAAHPLGAAWGPELGRAEVREFNPDGRNVRTYATGLRNCTAMALQPGSGALWCVVNERDGLGDDTPPDYATTVRRGAFYGWPWYYIGGHPDPRLGGRPDLKDKVAPPDLLLQAHTAPLGVAFYDGRQFPADYRGDAFIAMHGSWNRSRRVGYKVVRAHMSGGRPTGAVEDFMTGFVLSDQEVWGRPVGVAVAADGSLLVSDDGSGSLWRVTWAGGGR